MNNPWNIIGWFIVACLVVGIIIGLGYGLFLFADSVKVVAQPQQPNHSPYESIIASLLIFSPVIPILILSKLLPGENDSIILIFGIVSIVLIGWWVLQPSFSNLVISILS